MRWNKLGQIFNPADWDLGAGIVGYAQSPQALVFDDFVRIYFSTRRACANGKFHSTIRFVDFAKDFSRILRVSSHDVIADGALGSFDEHGIFPMNVLRVEGKLLAYTSGWSRRKSVDVDMAIGLAQSHDNGETFVRRGMGPVLCASLHEPFLVGDPFVRVYDSIFHMWYIFGTAWKIYPPSPTPERIYKIAHASSVDGVHWVKDEGMTTIANVLGVDECQALPSVITIAGRHHMFFCYRYANDFRVNPARGYRIGHAVSDDLLHWTRDDAALCLAPSANGWDSEMLCYPHVFNVDEKIYLLYNGNAFGKHGFGIAQLE